MEREKIVKWLGAHWGIAAAVLLAVAHFIVILHFFSPGIHSPDASGYHKQARLLVETGRTGFTLEKPLQYVNAHWFSGDNQHFFSQYPPGMAWLLAPGRWLEGTAGALLTDPVLAALALLGMYGLARRWGLAPGWALLALVVLAVNPAFNEHALWQGSHIGVLFCLVFGALALTRWAEDDASAWWGLAAGLLWGMIPTLRYPETLYGLAVATFALLHWRREKRYWLKLAMLVAGAAVPLVALAVRNHFAFGACWRTGYALTGEQTAFSWANFTRNAPTYLQEFGDSGLGWFGGLGVAGLGFQLFHKEQRRFGLLSLLVVLPVTLLYMSYYWGRGTNRFLLPLLPLLMVAGVVLLAHLAKVARGPAIAAAVFLLAVVAAEQVPQSLRQLESCRDQGRAVVALTAMLESSAPPGAIVIASERISAHLDVIGQWRLVDENALRGGRRPTRAGVEDGGVGPRAAQQGRIQELAEIYGGGLSQAAWEDIVKWSGEGQRPIFWLGEKEMLASRLGSRQDVVLVAEKEVVGGRMGLGMIGARGMRNRIFNRQGGQFPGPGFPGGFDQPGPPGMPGFDRGTRDATPVKTTWALYRWLGK